MAGSSVTWMRGSSVTSRDEMSAGDARLRIQDSDNHRAAWHSKYFGIDYESPYAYHLVLNATRLSDSAAADLIAHLVKAGSTRERVHVPHSSTPSARQDWGWVDLIGGQGSSVRGRTCSVWMLALKTSGAGSLNRSIRRSGNPRRNRASIF